MKSYVCISVILAFLVGNTRGQSAEEVVSNWLKTNAGVSRLKVNFTQKQAMRTLKIPVKQRGTLWLDLKSKRFRWDVGKTVVTGDGTNLIIQRTRSKKFEKRAQAGGTGGPPGLASMTSGFPKTLDTFKKAYRILKVTTAKDAYNILTQPLNQQSRGIKTFTFKVSRENFVLKGMELVLQDKSRIATNFEAVTKDPSFPSGLFNVDLTGYKETKFKRR